MYNIKLFKNLQNPCCKCRDKDKKIFQLQLEIEGMKQDYQELAKEHNTLQTNLSSYFNHDQVAALKNPSHSVKQWDANTIKKAILIQSIGSTRVLNYCRKNVAPLPCDRTLRSILQNLSLKPGILHEVISILNTELEHFTPSQMRMGIVFDEKALVPGESIERMTKNYYGKVTLPPGEDYADNVLVFLLVGIEIRVKEIVAYHFISKKSNADSLARFLKELIRTIEKETLI